MPNPKGVVPPLGAYPPLGITNYQSFITASLADSAFHTLPEQYFQTVAVLHDLETRFLTVAAADSAAPL